MINPVIPALGLKENFPLLSRSVDGHLITYLDSASTAPKPSCVIEAVLQYYEKHMANVHRGVHGLSEETTALFEQARYTVASFFNASPNEIIFTRDTTEAINLVAHGLQLRSDDEVILPASEHHSNFMPWRVRAQPIMIELDAEGIPFYDEIDSLFSAKTKLVTLAQVSNILGLVAPVEHCIASAHAHGVPVLIDAAQSASHLPIDVKAMNCDFLVASSHKLLGPSGVGVLYGKREFLESFPLYQTGGGMVKYHGDTRYEVYDIPFCFEAGTPNIEGVIGFGAALSYLRSIGMKNIQTHSQQLGAYIVKELSNIEGIKVIAQRTQKSPRIGLASFSVNVPGLSADVVARQLYDRHQILVSGGYHCAHIPHHRLNLDGTVRVSTQVFNSLADIDHLCAGLNDILAI